jgi:dihydropyrimidine dehydrogenase (NADP+)
MTDLGVKVFYNKEFGRDITYDSLKQDGYQKIFFGVGFDEPKTPLGLDIYFLPNVFHSKSFLPMVCENVKKGMKSDTNLRNHTEIQKMYKLHGHVMVLGIGDTALDCARSALRLGAERVSVVFRRGFEDLRANDEIFNPALYDKINFIPYSVPVQVHSENNYLKSVEFMQYMPDENGKYLANKEEKIKISCDFLITAFGSENGNLNVLNLLKNKSGKIDFDKKTYQHKIHKDIFLGGDITNILNLVDAVNDGKVASWHIHKQIQAESGHILSDEMKLPGFYTEIDKVDISVNMAGVHFDNPFGLASAPPTTSYPMIKRAFDQGWGFAVIKSFLLDKDEITNISPRIFKATNSYLQKEPSFSNIELISEKRARYWVEGAKEIIREYPNKVLIGSIMASPNQKDWEELIEMCNEAGFPIVELNLSCNHGMPDKKMGKACSDDPEIVGDITRWVVSKAKMPVFIKLSPNSSINKKNSN